MSVDQAGLTILICEVVWLNGNEGGIYTDRQYQEELLMRYGVAVSLLRVRTTLQHLCSCGMFVCGNRRRSAGKTAWDYAGKCMYVPLPKEATRITGIPSLGTTFNVLGDHITCYLSDAVVALGNKGTDTAYRVWQMFARFRHKRAVRTAQDAPAHERLHEVPLQTDA